MNDGRTTTTGGPPEASAGDADALRLQVEALSVEAEFLRRALEGRDADRSRQESALSALLAERDALAARLDAILSSTTWRATAPLRRGLARWRGARGRPETAPRPAPDPQATQPPPDRAEVPPAWYGAIRLEAGQLSGLGRMAGPYGPGVYEGLTQAVARRYGHVTVDEGAVAERARSEAAPLARRRLASVRVPDGVRPSETPARYAIVTPFYRHLAFFGPCAASVAALTEEGGADAARVEWIVVNDDPGVTAQELEALIPDSLAGPDADPLGRPQPGHRRTAERGDRGGAPALDPVPRLRRCPRARDGPGARPLHRRVPALPLHRLGDDRHRRGPAMTSGRASTPTRRSTCSSKAWWPRISRPCGATSWMNWGASIRP